MKLKNSTILSLGAAATSLVLVSFLVLQTTSATFTDSTSSPGESWTAGTVVLDDNDGGTALFSVDGLVPGDTGSKCIEVTYSGSADPSAVKLYVSALADTDGAGGDTAVASGQLSDDLDLTVDLYAAGESCATGTPTTNVFSGTLNTFGTANTDYSSGVGTWDPTASSDLTRAYNFTWTLGTDTADDAQGDGSTATFTWETQAGS